MHLRRALPCLVVPAALGLAGLAGLVTSSRPEPAPSIANAPRREPSAGPAAAGIRPRGPSVRPPAADAPARAVARREAAGVPARPARGASEMLLADPEILRSIAATSEDPREVQAAVWAIGNRLRLSPEDSDVLAALLVRIPEDQPALARTVLWALSIAPERLPVDAAIRLARTHPAEDVRRAAVRALGLRGGGLVREVLLEAAERDPAARNRREAIVFLTALASPGAATALARRGLAEESDPLVRAGWVNLAGAAGDEEALPILEEIVLAAAEAPEVRAEAGAMLAGRSPARAAEIAASSSLPAAVREALGS